MAGDDHPQLTAAEALRAVVDAVERAGGGWSFESGAGLSALITSGGAGGETWPLVSGDGSVIGVVRRNRSIPADVDDLIVTLLRAATALADAERRAAAAEARAASAEEESRLDPLTGLANRRAWELTLVHEQARSRRTGSSAVVLVVDVDGLKEANDTHGHLAGDLLLRTTAQALQRSVREGDVVARLGGDEFGVLAVDWSGPVPESLIARVEEALDLAGVSASVGGAVPEVGESLLSAFHRADEDMYATKRARKAQKATAAAR